ncbi:MAG: RluA family pseudouridine synthase [Polyangiaceae bacterium]
MTDMPQMMSPLTFEIVASDPRERLDKLVVALLARAGVTTSRAAVQRWIEHGRVEVDGRVARASVAVPVGARLTIAPEPPEASTAVPDASIELRVVFEDAHLLVIDKPAGLVVHPAKGHASGTLVNALLSREGFARAPADPRDPIGHLRPGIVHRLDKGTSGLLVVAKDEATREALKALFARHDIERAYVAIVVGAARDERIETLHGRHPTDRLRFTTRVASGKRAVTDVRVLERFEGASLVECRLATGRTHQIRVHLAERMSAPVLGDPLYGKPPADPVLRALADDLGHQALHARVLGFVHPKTGAAMRWESPPPADFERALTALRARSKAPTRRR